MVAANGQRACSRTHNQERKGSVGLSVSTPLRALTSQSHQRCWLRRKVQAFKGDCCRHAGDTRCSTRTRGRRVRRRCGDVRNGCWESKTGRDVRVGVQVRTQQQTPTHRQKMSGESQKHDLNLERRFICECAARRITTALLAGLRSSYRPSIR